MIHSTAIIADGARIGEGVDIGPYAVIDGDVTVGDGCRIGPHAYITGHTTIGPKTRIHTGAVVGDEPQDHHYAGETTYTEIGAGCVIREYVTIHRGTAPGSKTIVGDGCMIMGFAHLGHNCHIGNHVVIANSTLCAGHVEVDDRAFISGGCLIHQFVRIGRLAMVGGGNSFGQDIPPFCMLQTEFIQGANVVGLKRAGLSPDVRQTLKSVIRTYFFGGMNRAFAVDQIRAENGDIPEVAEFIDFVENTKRGVMPGRLTRAREAALMR